jgi:hypothetical protein
VSPQKAPVEVVWLKVSLQDGVADLRAQTDRLRSAGVPTPSVLCGLPGIGAVGHATVPGRTLSDLRADTGYADWMEPAAAALRGLQAAPLEGLRIWRPGDEADELARQANLLRSVVPDLGAELDRLVAGLGAGLAALPPALATSHGDFYDDQLLVGDSGVELIDLDELRHAHPVMDRGNMVAHLRVGASRGEPLDTAIDWFTEATLQTTGFSGRELALAEAAALVRLAPGPFRRLEPGWPDGVRRIVGLATERLAAATRLASAVHAPRRTGPVAASNRMTSGPGWRDPLVAAMPAATASDNTLPLDPALPQLGELTDGPAMISRFRLLLGRPGVRVVAVTLERHKPGRRAILRYDVVGTDGGQGLRLYGKVFASKRAPKVHDVLCRIAAEPSFGPDVSVPGPAGWLPDLNLLVQHAVVGEPVTQRLLAGDVYLVRQVADALSAFHRSARELGRRHDQLAEFRPLPRRTEEAAAIHPELVPLAADILGRLNRIDLTRLPWRDLPIHRDAYHDQFLVAGNDLAVLDLDDAAMSEPAIDIANVAGHLVLLRSQAGSAGDELVRIRRAFLDRAFRNDPDLDPTLLSVLEAGTLLRLSGIHASRADGHRVVHDLLTAAASHLDALERGEVRDGSAESGGHYLLAGSA